MSQFETNKRKAFADTLRSLMKSWESANGRRLSQEALGEHLFVARETVSGWLNGKQYPQESTLSRLADFFHVPVSFFSDQEHGQGLMLTDRAAHDALESDCERYAVQQGLSFDLVGFIKNNPDLADQVVSACWVNPAIQSIDPSVPAVPDHPFQFVSGSGVKVYLPPEVILMLVLVQRDLAEAAEISIRKHARVINDYYTGQSKHDPPSAVYRRELRGMEGLADVEEVIVDIYRTVSPDKRNARIKSFLDRWDKTAKSVDGGDVDL